MPNRSAPLAVVKADLFKALGHPVRVRVLELLSTGDQSVTALLEATGLEASHLSQQLGVLRRGGLVISERVEGTVVYALCSSKTTQLLAVAKDLLIEQFGGANNVLADLVGEPLLP